MSCWSHFLGLIMNCNYPDYWCCNDPPALQAWLFQRYIFTVRPFSITAFFLTIWLALSVFTFHQVYTYYNGLSYNLFFYYMVHLIYDVAFHNILSHYLNKVPQLPLNRHFWPLLSSFENVEGTWGTIYQTRRNMVRNHQGLYYWYCG